MAEQPPAAVPSMQKQTELPTYGTGIWMSYKIGIGTRVRSSLHSIARFFRIMPQPSYNLFEEFQGLEEDYSSVETYYLYLSKLYTSPKACSLDRNRWKVTEISTYKSKKSFQHESLVANVECEGETVYLRMERSRSKQKASRAGTLSNAKMQVSDDSDPSENVDDRPTGGSSSDISPRTAHDTITYSHTLKTLITGGEECIEVVRFAKGKGLSLSQITVLARSVHGMGKTYYPLKANCYWFADLVAETARLIEPDCQVTLVSESKMKPGELNLLPVTKPRPVVIKEAKAAYDKQWTTFNEDIHKAVNNENSPIYKQALQREEEERKAKEEERKAKEEERKAKEEERRRREEAERKAEEAEKENKQLKALLAAKTQTADGANSL